VTLDVLERAKAAGVTPLTMADQLVAERVRPAGGSQRKARPPAKPDTRKSVAGSGA
jgi:hypothetical protein